MRGNLSRAERYRKLAVKYHELGKFARPPYLGDFYRGVAVRYALMAQEAAERARKQSESGTEQTEQTELPPVNYSPAHGRDRTRSSTFHSPPTRSYMDLAMKWAGGFWLSRRVGGPWVSWIISSLPLATFQR